MRIVSRRTALVGLAAIASPAISHAQQAGPATPAPEPAEIPILEATPSPGQAVENVSLVMPGDYKLQGKLYKPADKEAPGVILVPDGWGLTPGFEAMGVALAQAGILGLVVDMLGGKTARDQATADRLAREVNPADAADAISAWYDWLRARAEASQRVAAFGFGPGGRWAVEGSIRKTAHGVAIWSSRIETQPSDLATIYETFIAHYSDRDSVPGAVLVAEIEARLTEAGRKGYFYRYDARPYFYNPASADYDRLDAQLSWRRTMEIYRKIWDL